MLSRVLSSADAGRARPLAFLGASSPQPRSDADPSAAENEIRALRAELARREAEIGVIRAHEFESGRRQAEEAARSEISRVIERVNASVAELAGLRQELRRSAERDVVQLALLIAKRVLHRELSVDPGALTALARVVFERMATAESYRVTTSPPFADSIRSAIPGHARSRIQIESDANCAPGAFIVRSEDGIIDASVDAQLEEIGRGLADRLSGV